MNNIASLIPIRTPADIAADAMETMQSIRKSIETALEGRMVRVTSNHNGQPIGRSRKSWKGQVCKIKHVYISLYDAWNPPGRSSISLQLEGHEYECFIPANEVEFV